MIPRLASSATIASLLALWYTCNAECRALSGVHDCHEALPQLSLLVLQGSADTSTQVPMCEGRDSRRVIAGGSEVVLGECWPPAHLPGRPNMELFS